MSFSYDPNKNQQNIELRGLNFDRAAELDWDNAWIYEDERNEYNEMRLLHTACLINDCILFVSQKLKMVSVLFHFEKQITER
jgi:uncharacterized DUF497 family protein